MCSNIIHHFPNIHSLQYYSIIFIYLCTEIAFYFIYKLFLQPRANDLTKCKIQPYRDYGYHRHILFERILNRLKETSKLEGSNHFEKELDEFLRNWFCSYSSDYDNSNHYTSIVNSNDTLSDYRQQTLSTSTTPSITSTEHENENDESYDDHFTLFTGGRKSLPKHMYPLYKEDLEKFFSWAFFSKDFSDLNNSWEKDELNKMFSILNSKYGISYPDVNSDDHDNNPENKIKLKPIQYTLENVNSLHRPICVYLIIWLLKIIGYLVLFFVGFRRYSLPIHDHGKECKVLSYWYRPSYSSTSSSEIQTDINPILFFHGIAPAGLTFYLPLLRTLLFKPHVRQNHYYPIFLFENEAITSQITFEALDETQTVSGVIQALKNHGFGYEGNNVDSNRQQRQNLILCGHSFGSCTVTWLLKNPATRRKIQKIILFDPVAILLSEPDVVSNFIYGNSNYKEDNLLDKFNKAKIRLAASSELFINHYLRRNFAWYNSELWLEDIPENIDVRVFIAEKDEIINAKKVKFEINRHNLCVKERGSSPVKLTYWNGVGHAACLANPRLWSDLRSGLVSNEYKKKSN